MFWNFKITKPENDSYKYKQNMSFYFVQNVWNAPQYLEHMHSKNAKSAHMTLKIFYVIKAQGSSARRGF